MSTGGGSRQTVTVESGSSQQVEKGAKVSILLSAFGEAWAKEQCANTLDDWEEATWEGIVHGKAPDHKQMPNAQRWYVKFPQETKNSNVAESDLTVVKAAPKKKKGNASAARSQLAVTQAAAKRREGASAKTAGAGAGSGVKKRKNKVLADGYGSEDGERPINFQVDREEDTPSTQRLLENIKWKSNGIRRIDPGPVNEGWKDKISEDVLIQNGTGMTEVQWLDIWFPTEIIFKRGVKMSNLYIVQNDIRYEGKQADPLTLAEVYIARALMLTISSCSGGTGEEDFWKKTAEQPHVAYNFGQYMQRHRYRLFKTAWHTEDNLSDDYDGDPLKKLRWLLELLQKRAQKAVTPGLYLVEDETIIPWDGRGLPYRKSIDRKPHDGWFLWTVCGSSKIILNFEVGVNITC
jgi:hypothetical protein